MTVELNHTIGPVRDKEQSAAFVTRILDLAPPRPCQRESCGVIQFPLRDGRSHRALLAWEPD